MNTDINPENERASKEGAFKEGAFEERAAGRGHGRGLSKCNERRGAKHGRKGAKGQARKGVRKRRGKRPLHHGDLPLLLLSLIADTPSHGYGLIGQIKARTDEAYAPSPGVLYPALETLQDLGLVEMGAKTSQGVAEDVSKSASSKRTLMITQAGEEKLASSAERLSKIDQRLSQLSAQSRSPEQRDVRGAMRAVKRAARAALGRAPDTASEAAVETDEAKASAIIAILAEARSKIEALDSARGDDA